MQVIRRLFPFSRGLFEVMTLVLCTYRIRTFCLYSGQGRQLLVFNITSFEVERFYVSG
jgi:hypothetical protein